MAFSLAIIIILALSVNYLFEKIKLPGFLGMLILGILLGPHCLNIISPSMLAISPDLRKIALIIILLRAGLGINKKDLKAVGKPAVKMSFIPCILEGITIAFISTIILNFSFIQGCILGFIIAAVSPAVIVPQMIHFIENNIGTNKGIPTLILASSSIDDILAITFLTTSLGIYGGENINMFGKIFGIPMSILLGIFIGYILSLCIIKIFKKFHMPTTKKVLILISLGILLNFMEDLFKHILPIASLLSVMTIGFVIKEKMPEISGELSSSFNKIWTFAEILLFVLVGSEVNIAVALHSRFSGCIIILFGLLGRSLGVLISLFNSQLNIREKIFCIISYVPKATVQAAMGALPLSLGVEGGEIILAISVLSILITAPLGSIGIKLSYKKLLNTIS